MNKNIKKQALAMILATATLAMAAVAAPAKKKAVSIPKVSFIVKGKLMTQSAAGGAVRAATTAEKNHWRKPPMTSAVSPNGKLEVKRVVTQDGENRYTSFQVVRRDNANVVLSAERLAKIIHFEGVYGRLGMMFDCWLPDSQHIAVMRRDGSSSGSEYYHYIINVNTGNVLRFDGWLAPNGKSAIVPNKEYDAWDPIWSGIDTISMPEKDSTHNGVRKWYIAQIPKGIVSYRFSSAAKRLITGAGSWDEPVFVGPKHEMGARQVVTNDNAWFRFTSYVYSTFADKGGADQEAGTIWKCQPEKIAHSPVVEFSRDSHWAICNGIYIDLHDMERQKSRAYLISMTTGKVRALPGIQAHFVN